MVCIRANVFFLKYLPKSGKWKVLSTFIFTCFNIWEFFFLLTYWTLKLIGDNDFGLSCVCHGGAVWVPREVSWSWQLLRWNTCKGLQIFRRCSFLVNVRVPLTRGKTPRQILEEQGLWEEYKQNNTYDPMARFNAAGIVPMTKDSEVSVWPWKGNR